MIKTEAEYVKNAVFFSIALIIYASRYVLEYTTSKVLLHCDRFLIYILALVLINTK